MKATCKAVYDFLQRHKEQIISALVIVAIFITIMVLAYNVSRSTQPQKVTTETQTQVQTESGIEKAADNARVPINREQAQDAAKEITHIYETHEKPEYTVIVPSGQIEKEADNQRKINHADFAIVAPTNSNSDATKAENDTKSSDSTISTAKNSNTVELNQYNVHAYKKVLRTIEVSPNIDGTKGIGEAGFSVSRKITDDGKYLGVGADYNFDNHRTYLKVSYTW